ncbi:DUF397 domain-containing protein [Amycolatopsis sp. DG1A-15b]|uniref:DUF397 domain-containing protein n=1 Tax=Amycolatopsis sp. DG1A-15b TaxID=3052846 RepID=UPI00255B78A3|nr:DUF397 domain-containing protein [Amycolatopsis sp. DG1A-15b]WIX86927.1 DUF397 domain-containing protein [Amycolatopsis sp. DG1A-15b]
MSRIEQGHIPGYNDFLTGTAIATRDSKAPAAGALEVPPAAWSAFLSAVTTGGPAAAAR